MRPLLAILLCLAALGLPVDACAQDPPPRRVALVIGEAAYRSAGEASRAVAQARLAADMLKGAGWELRPVVENADRGGLERAVAEFAAALKPGDAALLYYSGLSAKGPPTAAGEGTENWLLPVEAAPKTPADLPKQAIALSSIAERLASAGPKILIVDAARATVPEGEWNAPFGLVEPTNKAFVDAYVVFAAGLNRVAIEDRFVHSLFDMLTAEPNLTAAQLFKKVSQAVTGASSGAQTPWAAGASRSARLVLWPKGDAPRPSGDQDLYDQAVACGTRTCLREAAAQVSDRKLKLDLTIRAGAASAADTPLPAAGPTAGVAVDSQSTEGMSYAEAVVEQNKADTKGRSLIGQNFFHGRGGFPKNPGQAYIWLIRAANEGDAEANYLFGLSMHASGPLWPRKDWTGAMQHFRKAADQGDARSQYFYGMYQFTRKYPAMPANPAEGVAWLTKAAAAGEPRAKAVLADRALLERLSRGEMPADWAGEG